MYLFTPYKNVNWTKERREKKEKIYRVNFF